MHWLVFNFLTVTLTGLILPSMIRYVIFKRPLNKIASVIVVGVNVLLVMMFWIFLRGVLLPEGEAGGPAPTYLLLGLTLGMLGSWAMLTKQESEPGPSK